MDLKQLSDDRLRTMLVESQDDFYSLGGFNQGTHARIRAIENEILARQEARERKFYFWSRFRLLVIFGCLLVVVLIEALQRLNVIQ